MHINFRFERRTKRALLSVVLAYSLLPTAALPWAETDDDDLIVDAPWRTMRAYWPVLFFAPELSDGQEIRHLRLFNYDLDARKKFDVVFEDNHPGGDKRSCLANGVSTPIPLIGPEGEPADLMGPEPISDFWHVIARIPVGCIGVRSARGKPGVHYLMGEIESDPDAKIHSRLMRVVVSSAPLPRFSPEDRYYDTHVHTVAETTVWSPTNVEAARKMFGGPLAMIVESAYALGMIDTQLNGGNWRDFHNQIATTDHNVFFSGKPYDSGTEPGYGPTARTNGEAEEFQWYRDHFGELGGEEVTLPGTGIFYSTSPTARLGSHYLVYGAPHIEGPWHGGDFAVGIGELDIAKSEGNDNTIHRVHQHMSGTNGFGYAAHPFSTGIGWNKDLIDTAMGLSANDPVLSPQLLNADGTDFVFKGLQLWNGVNDYVARESGSIDASDQDQLDPFSGSRNSQTFVIRSPRKTMEGVDSGVARYVEILRRGLTYAFRRTPRTRFIRKIYMSAGTDAHGDFNYESAAEATVLAEINDLVPDKVLELLKDPDTLSISANAYGRARTYTLTSEHQVPDAPGTTLSIPSQASGTKSGGGPLRLQASGTKSGGGPLRLQARTREEQRPASIDPIGRSVEAYRNGNTILTSNPICKVSLDANCRLDSPRGTPPRWHDSLCSFENPDGQIGGAGKFDGGKSALFIRRQGDIHLRTAWDDIASYHPERPTNEIDFEIFHISRSEWREFDQRPGVRTLKMVGRTRGTPGTPTTTHDEPMGFDPEQIAAADRPIPQAIFMRAESENGFCITNPIWMIPVDVEIEQPPACPMPVGTLRVTLRFGVSMSRAEVIVQPLDGTGNGESRSYPMTGGSEWSTHAYEGYGVPEIGNGMLMVSNAVEIPCPAAGTAGWNAERHAPADRTIAGMRGAHSYAVIARGLHDVHGNRLNDVGQSITLRYGLEAGTGTTGTISFVRH